MSIETYIAEDEHKRLDTFLSEESEYSRSRIQAWIETGRVLRNGIMGKNKDNVHAGDVILVDVPETKHTEVVPENIPINIVYEDEDLCVIDKPRGMVVHPAPGNESGTLVNALLYHFGELSSIGGEFRPGIVHRIDKMTGGLLVVAKNDAAHESLSRQFALHTAGRKYMAIVHGNIKEDNGTVDAPIDRHPIDRKRMAVQQKGRHAVTHFEVLERFSKSTLIACTLETGRTHQIRVHMAYIKHPLLGDSTYCSSPDIFGLGGQVLHGYKLSFTHPKTGERLAFCSPLPECMLMTLKKLGWTGVLPDDYSV